MIPLMDHESGDRACGYLVLRSYEAHDGSGRVVLVDRGAQYMLRYAVGYQPAYARGWIDGALHADRRQAEQTFAAAAERLARSTRSTGVACRE